MRALFLIFISILAKMLASGREISFSRSHSSSLRLKHELKLRENFLHPAASAVVTAKVLLVCLVQMPAGLRGVGKVSPLR